MRTYSIILSALLLLNFQHEQKITIWMIGDSTMSIKEKRAYPETGWGMPFANFFDSTVVIENHARNGRSTKTFISEKLWDKVVANIRAGDHVFIQFGHNDESKEKAERYTTPEQYTENLTRFVNETRAKKGVPVLLTPVSRRRFKDGKALATHEEYSPLVKRLAVKMDVALIDIDASSIALYQELGEEQSKMLFLQLKPGEHPNYPEGKTDNTHFNELGARLIAQLVLSDIQRLKLDIAKKIVKPVIK